MDKLNKFNKIKEPAQSTSLIFSQALKAIAVSRPNNMHHIATDLYEQHCAKGTAALDPKTIESVRDYLQSIKNDPAEISILNIAGYPITENTHSFSGDLMALMQTLFPMDRTPKTPSL